MTAAARSRSRDESGSAAGDGGPGRAGPPLHPTLRAAGEEGRLPGWARAGSARREHLARVADLMGGWAADLGLAERERTRWRAAGLLHDALKDADPSDLAARTKVSWPASLLHAPAVAAALRAEGVEDEELLRALSHHPVGHPDFGALGVCLYIGDWLDPGRSFRRAERAAMRERMPRERDEVAVEVAERRIRRLLDRRLAVLPVSVRFWNRLVAGVEAGRGGG